MFTRTTESVFFSSTRPTAQLVADSQDCRVLVLGLEPGQEVPPQASSSTVILHVVTGHGRLCIGTADRSVAAGDLAICPPHAAHAVTNGPGERMTLLIIIAPQP